jgi:hypothetical protein
MLAGAVSERMRFRLVRVQPAFVSAGHGLEGNTMKS